MLKFIIRFIIIGGLILFIDRAVSSSLKNGLIEYDKLDKRAAVLCVGSSYSESGIDQGLLEYGLGVPVVKYIKFGSRSLQRLAMLKIYLQRHGKLPKVVVYDVDPALFEFDIAGDHPYIRYYPFMDVPDISAFIKDSGATAEELFSRNCLLMLRYNDPPTIWRSLKGHLGGHDVVSNAVADLKNHKNLQPAELHEFNAMLQSQALEKVIDFVTSHDSKLVLLFLPQAEMLNQSRADNVKKAVALFRKYEATNSKVVFWDYNSKYEKMTDIFADHNHVNAKGQSLVMNDLIPDLKKLLIVTK
jgi:hypothetical protein